MKAYIADLSAYNAGCLEGIWLDLEGLDSEDITTEIETFLESQTKKHGELREEYAVHDWDTDPEHFGEWPDWDKVSEWFRMYDQHGDAWEAYCEYIGANYATEDDFENRYHGTCDSMADWAEEFLESGGVLDNVPEELRFHIDFDSYAKEQDVYFVRGNGEFHVIGTF